MRRFITIFLLIYYSAGTLYFPLGDISYITDLHKMYDRCSEEDPDITPIDFVVEHIMNLEDVAAFFEEERHQNEEQEKPHQQYFSHAASQSIALTVSPYAIPHPLPARRTAAPDYPSAKDPFIPSGYTSGIFKPPVAV